MYRTVGGYSTKRLSGDEKKGEKNRGQAVMTRGDQHKHRMARGQEGFGEALYSRKQRKVNTVRRYGELLKKRTKNRDLERK